MGNVGWMDPVGFDELKNFRFDELKNFLVSTGVEGNNKERIGSL